MSVIWVDVRAKRNQPKKEETAPSEDKKVTAKRTRAKKDVD